MMNIRKSTVQAFYDDSSSPLVMLLYAFCDLLNIAISYDPTGARV